MMEGPIQGFHDLSSAPPVSMPENSRNHGNTNTNTRLARLNPHSNKNNISILEAKWFKPVLIGACIFLVVAVIALIIAFSVVGRSKESTAQTTAITTTSLPTTSNENLTDIQSTTTTSTGSTISISSTTTTSTGSTISTSSTTTTSTGSTISTSSTTATSTSTTILQLTTTINTNTPTIQSTTNPSTSVTSAKSTTALTFIARLNMTSISNTATGCNNDFRRTLVTI
ncbi:unnamed protein product [Adineta ricciae]|uniref:Uncharacterized protein n=1 Tax=Adineta ricciae TaxID=249248 RepID=A0A816A5G2_ADIRI|nr:unnamed protein product [Adineta ricciae]